MPFAWPVREFVSAKLGRCQILMVASAEEVANRVASGENLTAEMPFSWSVNEVLRIYGVVED